MRVIVCVRFLSCFMHYPCPRINPVVFYTSIDPPRERDENLNERILTRLREREPLAAGGGGERLRAQR